MFDINRLHRIKQGSCWVGIALVILLASYLRFIAMESTVVEHNGIRGDAADYISYALNMRKYSTYSREVTFGTTTEKVTPDALRSPGYPAFIWMFLDAKDAEGQFEKSLKSLLAAQALMSVIVVGIWMYLFSRFVPMALAIVGGLLLAVNPHLVNANIYYLSESLFTFLLSLLFLMIYLLIHSKRLLYLSLTVVVIVIASLTRPSVQYFILPMLILLWYMDRTRYSTKIVSVFFLFFLLLMSSWSIRNKIETNEWSDPTLKANFLQHGMYPGFMFEGRAETLGFPYRYDPDNSVIYGNPGLVFKKIIDNFVANPQSYFQWYLFGKPLYLLSWNIVAGMGESFIYPVSYSPYFNQPLFTGSNQFARSTHWPVVVLSLIGCVFFFLPTVQRTLSLAQKVFLGCLILFYVYFIALHIVGAPFPRYAIPLRPVVVALALFTLWTLIDLVTKQTSEEI